MNAVQLYPWELQEGSGYPQDRKPIRSYIITAVYRIPLQAAQAGINLA